MKKTVFSIFGLFLSVALSAQFQIAPIGGLNLSSVRTVEAQNLKTGNSKGYYLGVQPSFAFSEKFSLGMGLQYATKGVDWGYTDSEELMGWRTSYVEAIPQVEFRLIPVLGVFAGGSIGYLIDEKVIVDGKKGTPVIDLAEKTDLGATVGFRFYTKQVFINLAVCHSIRPISEINFTNENGEPIDGAGKQYNQTVSLGVGYNFQFSKK